MNKRLILAFALVLLLGSIYFMASDFFSTNDTADVNPYEYNIDAYKEVDTSLIKWVEVQQIDPQMNSLKALSVDLQDNIYIGGEGKLIIYSREGHLKSTINTGALVYSLHVGPKGKIYVAMKDHVEVWNRSGRKLQSWEAVNDRSVLTSITSADTLVYVADAGNRVVYQYNDQGHLIRKIGEKNESLGIPGFNIPSPYFDLLVGRDDELWVVNPGRHQFEAYNMKGFPISSWQKTSMQLDGFSGCCNPTHISMLSNGDFVSSEKGIERVKIHQPNGAFKEVVAPPAAFEEGTVGLDLAVDTRDRILVLDPYQGLVRIFIKKNQ